MTKATATKAAPAQAAAQKAKTFYGISAKDFRAIVEQEANPVRLGDMLAFVHKRIADHTAKHPSRAARWKRVAEGITAKLNGTAAPALANAATFTSKPVAKGKARKAAAKAVDPIDALLSASGMNAQQLMLALAARVSA